MSEPAELAASTWFVVLPPSATETELLELRAALAARGWSADSSHGPEQAILAVEGAAGPADVRAALTAWPDADVFPLLAAEEYRRLRTRRRFQSALVTGLGMLVLLGLVLPLLGFLRPPAGSIGVPELVPVPRAGEIAVGAAALVLVPAPVLVLHLAPDRWSAVSASCTFMDDCRLEWDAERHELACPCHGCVFDVYGNVVHPPASLPLVRLQVVESGGTLCVRRTL